MSAMYDRSVSVMLSETNHGACPYMTFRLREDTFAMFSNPNRGVIHGVSLRCYQTRTMEYVSPEIFGPSRGPPGFLGPSSPWSV